MSCTARNVYNVVPIVLGIFPFNRVRDVSNSEYSVLDSIRILMRSIDSGSLDVRASSLRYGGLEESLYEGGPLECAQASWWVVFGAFSVPFRSERREGHGL